MWIAIATRDTEMVFLVRTMTIHHQARTLARMLGSAFKLGTTTEIRIHFQDGKKVEMIISAPTPLAS